MTTTKPTLLKKSLRYGVMPEVIPRLKEFNFNFDYLAYLVAYLFSITGLFGPAHPYLNKANIGRYGIRQTLVEGYKNLKWSRKHIDQIVLFGLVCLSFALIFGQLIVLALSFLSLTGTAIADSGVDAGLFMTTPPDFDLALMMLDRVFGIPDLFRSCIEQGIACSDVSPALPEIPWPMHEGLHAMFEFYSKAMLVVGIFIVLYYFFVIIIETAQTGTPFGQRFASIYAPLRLILAILIMLPLAHGINTGQYALLKIANWGSGLGTNAWKVFNINLSNAVGLETRNLVIKPNAPDMKPMVQFYHIAAACRASYDILYGKNIQPYFENGDWSNDFATALGVHEETKRISIIYGERAAVHSAYPGSVRPYCGKMMIELDDSDNPFSLQIYEAYYNILVSLWNNTALRDVADKAAAKRYHADLIRPDTVDCPAEWGGAGECQEKPSVAYLSELIGTTQANLNAALIAALGGDALPEYLELMYDDNHLDMGWGGAGLWFNKISNVNGGIVSAVFGKPYGQNFPEIMTHVANEKKKLAPGLYLFDRYDPKLPEQEEGESSPQIAFPDVRDSDIAGFLSDTYKIFMDDDIDPTPKNESESNMIGTILTSIFGADGLFDLRENSDVHPLAQMSGLGKSIIESAIQNIGIGLALSMGSGVASRGSSPNERFAAATLEGDANMAITIGTIALTTGFLLYYILPFLPFIYFFFAVGKWIKSIFEAMVAVPLWALAHLKIDGDGVAGPNAKNGYMLIFEIMLRPILTVFGLVAAISIFTALATMMNELFDLAAANLAGYDSSATPGDYLPGDGAPVFFEIEYYRSSVDQFFFTVLYAVIIYVLATACFKLIDMIPNSILRWMGEGVESFGDKAEDAADNLIRYAAIGGGMLGGQLTDSLKSGSKALGQGFRPFQ